MEWTAVVRATTFAMRMGKKERRWKKDSEEGIVKNFGQMRWGQGMGARFLALEMGKGSGQRMKSLVLA